MPDVPLVGYGDLDEDRGVAVVDAMVRGHGLTGLSSEMKASVPAYGDGVSIDDMERVARTAGLPVVQQMVPAEWVFAMPRVYLPAITSVRANSGKLAYLLLWRAEGGRVQVTDGLTREWRVGAELEQSVYRHSMPLPRAEGESWFNHAETGRLLTQFLCSRGESPIEAEALVREARAEGWRAMASLDAAARITSPGRSVRDSWRRTSSGPSPRPREYTLREGPEPGSLILRGAVLLALE